MNATGTAAKERGADIDTEVLPPPPQKSRSPVFACALLPCLVGGCVATTAAGLGASLAWYFGFRDPAAGTAGQVSTSTFMECRIDLAAAANFADDADVPCCNGLPSNCDLRADEVVYATVHDAMSSFIDGFVGANHLYPLEESLEAGYRALMLDSCDCGAAGTRMCHTLCETGSRDAEEVFRAVMTFLEANPSEVILLELQINDGTLNGLFEHMEKVPGFVDMMYSHEYGSPWPLMRSLVKSNKRLIVFQHDGGNCNVADGCPPGIHNTFTYAFETPWENTPDSLLDYEHSCSVGRGNADADFMISNHFVGYVPGLADITVAERVNAKDVLQKRMVACSERLGRHSNMIAVDFWSRGDVLEVVQLQNKLRAGKEEPSPKEASEPQEKSPSFFLDP